MWRFILIFIAGYFIVMCIPARGSLATNEKSVSSSQAVAVYGLSSADYLTSVETVQATRLPAKKYTRNRVRFNLPDSFYFIGAPIFLLILLRIIAAFIRFYEEERKEQIKQESVKVLEPE